MMGGIHYLTDQDVRGLKSRSYRKGFWCASRWWIILILAMLAAWLMRLEDAQGSANAAEDEQPQPTSEPPDRIVKRVDLPEAVIVSADTGHAVEALTTALFADFGIDYVSNRIGWGAAEHARAIRIVDSVMFWSGETGLNPFVVLAQIERESDFRVNLRGAAGEYGLMQIMGFWWHVDDIWNGERLDPSRRLDIDENIKGGCLILARHLGGSYLRALGQYNTGKPVVNGYARSVWGEAKEMMSDFVILYYVPAMAGGGE